MIIVNLQGVATCNTAAAIAAGFLKIGMDPVAEVFSLTDIDNLLIALFHNIDTGFSGRGFQFEPEVFRQGFFSKISPVS